MEKEKGMAKNEINFLKHFIFFGSFRQTESENGRVTWVFEKKGECWSHISFIPLTFCLPFGALNERRKHKAKALYKIRVRGIMRSQVMQNDVNAVQWKNKILTNKTGFFVEPNNHWVEGFFYEGGEEITS